MVRALGNSEGSPMSYRKAAAAFRRAGYVGGESRVRPIFRWLFAEDPEGEEPTERTVETQKPTGTRIASEPIVNDFPTPLVYPSLLRHTAWAVSQLPE